MYRRANHRSKSGCRKRAAHKQRLPAQAALDKSGDHLRLVLENVKDLAILSIDLRGKIIGWNAGAKRLFGYSEAEIIGQNFSKLFTPEDCASGAPEHELTQARDINYSPDDRWHLRKDGTRLFLNGTVRPLKDEKGKIHGFIKVASDLTARQRMQEQLEARLRQQAAVAQLGQLALSGADTQELMDQTMVLVTETLGVDLAKILELMPGSKDMLLRAGIGWKPGKVGRAHVGAGKDSQAGYTLTSQTPIISDDLRKEKRFQVLDLLNEHSVHSAITVIIKGHRNGGRPYGVLGACSVPLRKFSQDDVNFLQAIANVLATALDRNRFESALAQSEKRFRELAEAMPQIVWASRPDGQPEYYNQRWFDFTGLSAEESMAPYGWKKILHQEDVPICFKKLSAAVEAGEPYEAECRYRSDKNGRYRWHLVRAIPVKDEQGRLVRWFSSSTDIDDQKRGNEALEKARKRLRHYADDLEKRVAERTTHLQESVHSLEGVLYHVAHDLRGPLRAMQGLTTLLLEKYAPKFDAEGRDYAERVVRAATRMDALIRDLLAYGRLGHVKLPAQRIDLEKLAKNVLSQFADEINAQGAKLELRSPLAHVSANDTVLTQILINLISNALKFVACGVAPHVQIWTETDGQKVRLFVQDNGIGIDLAHHQRIFHVFERLHRVEDYPGTGIGLAIVMKGAERMGGRAGVESQPGQGSRFWIELPAASEGPTFDPPTDQTS
jgi:PAS domain S-box-containing protein